MEYNVRPSSTCPSSVLQTFQESWRDQRKTGSDERALLRSNTRVRLPARQARISICACCRNDCHDGILVYEVHFVDRPLFDLVVVLYDAKPINPQIALSNI